MNGEMTLKLPDGALLKIPAGGRVIELGVADFPASAGACLRAELSDSAFANLFLFRHAHGYKIHSGPLPHIRGLTYGDAELVFPLFNHAEIRHREILNILGETGWLYHLIRQRRSGWPTGLCCLGLIRF
jgi:hypothetical protein